MTDLERARLTYGVIRDFGWDVLWRSANPIPDDAWPIDILANALAAARREGAEAIDDAWAAGRRQGLLEGAGPTASWQLTQEYERGAEEMRERAARALDEDAPWAARAIRALHLRPEEPK